MKNMLRILGFIVGIATVLDIQQKGKGYQLLPKKAQEIATKVFAKR